MNDSYLQELAALCRIEELIFGGQSQEETAEAELGQIVQQGDNNEGATNDHEEEQGPTPEEEEEEQNPEEEGSEVEEETDEEEEDVFPEEDEEEVEQEEEEEEEEQEEGKEEAEEEEQEERKGPSTAEETQVFLRDLASVGIELWRESELEFRAELGEGGCGRVELTKHVPSGRLVAVKYGHVSI